MEQKLEVAPIEPTGMPASATTPRAPAASSSAGEWTIPISVGIMQLAGLASLGAGAVHAGAVGHHAETPTLARLFVAVAAAQLAFGLLALVRGRVLAALAVTGVNLVAVAAWGATRLWDISWIDGLEQSERPAFADTTCAALGAVAVLAGAAALIRRRTRVSRASVGVPGFAIGSLAIVAMLIGADHTHSHDAGAAEHSHDGTTGETADHENAGVVAPVAGSDSAWPRPWDPAVGVDFSGVADVTRAQVFRAAGLIKRTLSDLPQFSDVTTLEPLGYKSIGDSGTGYEHYINLGYFGDEYFLDPNYPESLVYRVDGDARTLVSAMFIAADTPVDDPELVDYGGPLMQWHSHEDLCWTVVDGTPQVVGTLDASGNCPAGSAKAGGGNAMVHVWIVPHECGPFAALEGHGAGQVAGNATARVDQCGHDHGAGAAAPAGETAELGHVDADSAGEVPVAWDPTMPIDLSGRDGVTPDQQAFAENLIASTLVDLPQWSDPAVAEEAGFRSIGDGATGHEHYIQWDWINDDVFLDPDHPESLVYEPQPDGSKKLVSAMYMLADDVALNDVPDWGGPLMQWHIHDNLCFDTSGDAPRVGGLTDAEGGCTAPLVKMAQSPMIHVWITPNDCGPFAALDGVGAGQVAEGEQHQCDHAHGA